MLQECFFSIVLVSDTTQNKCFKIERVKDWFQSPYLINPKRGSIWNASRMAGESFWKKITLEEILKICFFFKICKNTECAKIRKESLCFLFVHWVCFFSKGVILQKTLIYFYWNSTLKFAPIANSFFLFLIVVYYCLVFQNKCHNFMLLLYCKCTTKSVQQLNES